MKSFNVETLAIGDELLTGRISDTNSTFVARALFECGLKLSRQTVVADDPMQMKEAFRDCGARAQAVICFGGLGPTTDDLTVDVVSELLDAKPVLHPDQKKRLEGIYNERGTPVTDQALRQVRYPDKADPFANKVGLAPGFYSRLFDCDFYFLPGVPSEMEGMIEGEVLNRIKSQLGKKTPIQATIWRCIGIPESELQRKMNPLSLKLPTGSWLGYQTSYPENHLILYDELGEKADEKLRDAREEIERLTKDICYAVGRKKIEEVVVDTLKEKKLRVALAESCTAGLSTQRLTRVPGASEVVWGGIATYQIEAKRRLLNLDIKDEKQAVSKECTLKMAQALKEISGCAVTAAITGFMGPTGGDDENPQGTIYLAVLGEKLYEKKLKLYPRGRERRQWAASTYLIDLIREAIS